MTENAPPEKDLAIILSDAERAALSRARADYPGGKLVLRGADSLYVWQNQSGLLEINLRSEKWRFRIT